jgi:WD40 repeat protein
VSPFRSTLNLRPTRNVRRAEQQDILSLVFHPLHPHILASASSDRTIRIWNFFGTDVEEGLHDPPLSENYPQGDADEGSCVLAILAGDKAGHKAGVSALVRLSQSAYLDL